MRIEAASEESKVCTKCSRTKPLTAFQLQGGYRLRACKSCRNSLLYEQRKQRLMENPESLAAYRRYHAQYMENNKEAAAEYHRDYYLRNKEKILQRTKAWQKENKEANAARQALRRTRLADPGRFTREDVRALLAAQRYKCAACRCDVSSKYTVDHVVALANGGTNTKENIQILCTPCNSSKGTKDAIEFMQKRGYLL